MLACVIHGRFLAGGHTYVVAGYIRQEALDSSVCHRFRLEWFLAVGQESRNGLEVAGGDSIASTACGPVSLPDDLFCSTCSPYLVDLFQD